MLLLQSFLLLLSAFLLGAALACMLKRLLAGESIRTAADPKGAQQTAIVNTRAANVAVNAVPAAPVPAPTTTIPAAAAAAANTDRFGRVLTQAPVVQVQPVKPAAVEPPRPAPPPPPPPPAAVLTPKPPLTTPAPAPAPKDVTIAPAAAPAAAPVASTLAATAATAAAAAAAMASQTSRAEPPAPTPAAKAPEPVVVKAPEPVVAKAPEPVAVKAPEPVVVKAPEPVVIKAAEPVVAKPAQSVAVKAPEPVLAAPSLVSEELSTARDDLALIRGIDERVQPRLNALGIRRYWQIAGWTADDINRMSQSLGYSGRIEQENWIEQAQILSRGVDTEYSRKRRVELAPQVVAPVVSKPAAPLAEAKPATVNGSAVSSTVTTQAEAPVKPPEPAKAQEPVKPAEPVKPIAVEVNPVATAPVMATAPPVAAPTAAIAKEHIGAEAAAAAAAAAAIATATAAAAKTSTAIAEPAVVKAPVVTATVAAAPIAPAAPPDAKAAELKSDLSNLRSVRSEALRGTDPVSGTGYAPRVIGAFDDLKRIRGIGVLIERKLNSLGVTTYEQIANWTGADVDRVSQLLDFKGRVERENWIEQSRILASGGQTEFSRRVDRGEVETSR